MAQCYGYSKKAFDSIVTLKNPTIKEAEGVNFNEHVGVDLIQWEQQTDVGVKNRYCNDVSVAYVHYVPIQVSIN